MRKSTLSIGLVGSCLVLWAALPLGGNAATQAELQKDIEQKRSQVEQKRGKEKVLTRDIARYSDRIGSLQSRIRSLQARQSTIEVDLNAERSKLSETQTALRSERQRLVRLEKRLREVRTTLEQRLVEQYKEGRTDLLTVVIEADGFQQMLESGEYLSRLAAEDQKIIGIVSRARTEATATEKRLDRLERRQQEITAAVQARRDQIARVKQNVASTQASLRGVRNEKRTVLFSVKEERQHAEADLKKLEAASAKIQARLSGMPTADVRGGTGRFVYPMNGAFTSPFGARWGRLHAGIDIAAPVGTPIVAADGGRVAIAGSVSGYGNYTCIQHDSRISTCYAHQSRIGVSVGQQVTKGQTIGLCGNTGNSTGPHLHFEVRIGGSPVNPMNYL